MKKIIALAVMLLRLSGSYAQHFTIDEHFNKRKVNVKDTSKTAIVDINSLLEIKLNTANITTTLATKMNVDAKVTGELAKLNKILENEIILLQKLKPTLSPKADQKSQLAALGEVSKLMTEFLTLVMNEPELRAEANDIITEFYKLPPAEAAKYPNTEYYLITKFSLKNKKSLGDLKSGALSKVQVMLRGYLEGRDGSKRKVHIKNFDNYQDGEYFEVPTWVTSFSQEDIAQYNAAANFSKTANSLLNSNLSSVRDILASKLKSVDKIKALLAEIKNVRDNRLTYFAADITAADEYLKQLEAEITSISQAIENLKELKNGNVLELYNTVMQQVTDLGEKLGPNTTALATNLAQSIKTNPHITSLTSNLNDCVAAVKEDVEMIKSLKNIVNIFKPIQKTAAVVAEVSGESFSHSLNDLPDLGIIDLKNTGKRQNGDELQIELWYKIADSTKAKKEVCFDYKRLTLQQINFYSVASVGVIVANPYNKSAAVKITNKFQFAPTGSLLLKFGSRTSSTWNAVSPGIGITFPTPDLDLDGTPDFSFGGTTTVFKDILSFGLSYDTKTDSPFWHIGFSVPFNIFGGIVNKPAGAQ